MKNKMHVLIFINKVLPVTAYGGTERVAWYLAKELAQQGCEVTFLAAQVPLVLLQMLLCSIPNEI